MDPKENIQVPILFSCYVTKSRSSEHLIAEHSICYIESGTLQFQLPDKKGTYQKGDIFFASRNQLAKTIKFPGNDGEFKSTVVFFEQNTLKDISLSRSILSTVNRASSSTVTAVSANRLMINYFKSLQAYQEEEVSASILKLKVEEGLLLLLNIHPELQEILFDFSEPGKIDLEKFMNMHFKYNVDLKRFAMLTGRSITTFKRDFEKIFQISPSRWLKRKRLEEAYYLIKEKGLKATEVYLEVGFEDLSHFSFAFKQNYGVSPSLIGA
ncbi:helix-turn-helix domain-containing protein [Pedobacter metabolipauper]|uniref:AraC-like DNA-binding protein n=1 Tax=Pedobacter metabolipauper TaxID=425513 RepID=A0A4R6SV51_9SPHI|nr:AraC family transcriptional regulator [Pedobacter metabolipauper]TDQ08231.1 AraC-like DNA-binding protein [Pedobacter metabolipauper]